MALAVIAGMPRARAAALRDRIAGTQTIEEWSVAWVPSRTDQAELQTCWRDVKDAADAADGSGVHILAYHKDTNDRGQFEKEVRFKHRIVWLDHAWLYDHASDRWWGEIEERLRLEELWRERVRPLSHHHALILPSPTFSAERDPWTIAQRAETEDEFARAQDEIRIFVERYQHRGVWRDDAALLFDSGGAQHGKAPTDRRWKFTHQLPPSFHFDVKHEKRRAFSLVDAEGIRQDFREYTNVDAHGYVRGGR